MESYHLPTKTPFLRDMIPVEVIKTLPLTEGKLSSSLLNQSICTALRMAAIKCRDSYCLQSHQSILDSSYATVESCTKDIGADSILKSRHHMTHHAKIYDQVK